MISFSRKEITNQPKLGERLKEAREKLGLSLNEAAKATKISLRYLAAIEDGKHDELPGEVYSKNFLKVYTNFLGLNCQQNLSAYQSERKVYYKMKKESYLDFNQPVKRISQAHLLATPKIIKGAIIGFLVIACLFYLGLKIKAIMTPPLLIITQPADNLTTQQNFIEVIGQVEPETVLEINGQQVLADQDGNFKETLDLQPGVNLIEILAEKKHGQQTKVYRQIIVTNKESQEETSSPDNQE